MSPAPLRIDALTARRFVRRALLLDAPAPDIATALGHLGYTTTAISRASSGVSTTSGKCTRRRPDVNAATMPCQCWPARKSSVTSIPKADRQSRRLIVVSRGVRHGYRVAPAVKALANFLSLRSPRGSG